MKDITRHLILVTVATVLMVSCIQSADRTMRWTVPADDGSDCLTGDPVSYDLVWSTDPLAIVESDVPAGFWPTAGVTILTGFASGICGSTEDHTLLDMPPNTDVFVAVKYFDDNGNVAPISNIFRFATADEIAPGAVMDVR